MVLAKSGVAGSWTMAATSAAWSAKACSKAGRKCSGAISVNGGVSNGVCHAFRSGFAGAAGCKGSDIVLPGFRHEMDRQSIPCDQAFLGLLRLIAGPFSERLRPSEQDAEDELAALPDRRPPDRMAERRHRDQRR